ncbi:glutathione S-transferase family protein [Psychromarinibacter halotolerans]|uniref:Glutathione S-transferase family protein n=1 Tax=Psychromarinibacter halotolerans TaxID=1775175 RepID=A0ABV7GYD1_9RHOB|nr:glutathione S-transferase family protein [Psychromarinibacter halotolerans]MDF0596094.1 glutathione S-transferase family protein [Psychromarinibacter halotolerans]
MSRPVVYHIPVCPFSQRLEILLALKGLQDAVEFRVVDITKPRDPALLELSRGTTALPIMDLGDGRVLKESLVILRYVEEALGGPNVARSDPYERGIERLMITREGPFGMAGYLYVLNRDRTASETKKAALLEHYAWLSDFLDHHNPGGLFLFDDFGLAETVFTPLMMRFWFLDYYEGFELPPGPEYARVRAWREACLAHPAAQQVSYDHIVKLYYDYAVGAGNGALPDGRAKSSFTFDPDWRDRPMPPRDKYDRVASDAELGLI